MISCNNLCPPTIKHWIVTTRGVRLNFSQILLGEEWRWHFAAFTAIPFFLASINFINGFDHLSPALISGQG